MKETYFFRKNPSIYEEGQVTEKYPNLFKEVVWPSGPTSVQFETGDPPPEELISNINAVPTTNNGQWVVIQLDDGKWEIPGGTVEAGAATGGSGD